MRLLNPYLKKKFVTATRRLNAVFRPPPNMLTYWKKLSLVEAAGVANRLTTDQTSVFAEKAALRAWVFEKEKLGGAPDGLVLEFGVRQGKSILQIAATGNHVYGFDSFEGLRDPWSKPDRHIESMALGGKVPRGLEENTNITIVRGWVEDTLPSFLQSHHGPVRLAHLDLDVGPPTKFVLDLINERLVSGSLIVFDDFFGHIGWENHSYSAFSQACDERQFVCVAISPQAVVFQKI